MSIDDKIRSYHELRKSVLADSLSGRVKDPDEFLQKSYHQSVLFMVEIIPIIHSLYIGSSDNRLITVLDVGPKTFGGTSLLSSLHAQDTFSQLKMDVSAIDIVNTFDDLRKIVCPEVKFVMGNIFDLKHKYDLIICSHVIEHVNDPINFVKRLKDLANEYVIVACPWKENPIETVGHQNSIDHDFVKKSEVTGQQIFTNYMWGKRREATIMWYRT